MGLRARLAAEFLGTAGLLIVVVGSGIMGESLAGGNAALALLANSLATGAGLYALIQTFGSISGAHFNPAVSFVESLWKRLSPHDFALYSGTQIAGALTGVLLTHAMFGQRIFQLSQKNRGEAGLMLSEIVATFGLVTVISLSGKRSVEATPLAIAFYITSAYWCTSSTSFANPAVTIARSFTDTFTGIQWTGAPGFIVCQFLGGTMAYAITKRLAKT
jgi:glycerol uptake facilitator-like aquaporin